jgi:hypothetical protein
MNRLHHKSVPFPMKGGICAEAAVACAKDDCRARPGRTRRLPQPQAEASA